MKKIKLILYFIFLSLNFCVYCQSVEVLVSTEQIKLKSLKTGNGSFPEGLFVDEIDSTFVVNSPRQEYLFFFNIKDHHTIQANYENRKTPRVINMKLLNDYWGESIQPMVNGEYGPYIKTANGISFILKKEHGFIVYYLDEQGIPGAVDTTGKIYTNHEAIDYLKQADPLKFEQGRDLAIKNGAGDKFDKSEILVWGNRWFNSQNGYFYIGISQDKKTKESIHYDLDGNSYQCNIFQKEKDNNLFDCFDIVCSSPDDQNIFYCDVTNYTSLLKGEYTISMYTGFGGNIYYYISGPEYTEVFRIRRTWGDPNFYAMAVNGYTEDEYGEYVNSVLLTLSKSDLRLLRNTVFAIYGVHFKSEDLSKHFDKQVWYTDKGLISGDVTLPAHRQKLVEMIQKLEK